MTTGNAGFDARLNEVLEQQAARTGESTTEYVRRAVVTRLVKELTEADDTDLGHLLKKLEASADPVARPAADSGDTDSDPAPPSVIDDPARLRAVQNTGLLDSPPEPQYDRIVAMAADALSTPCAAVSLIDHDRQFIKSAIGLGPEDQRPREIPLDTGMCRYTVEKGEPLLVEDARLDDQFKNHPGVLDETFVSYLGIPLVDDAGQAVGTLCVWDAQPRQWTTGHVQVLKDIAWMVRERIFE